MNVDLRVEISDSAASTPAHEIVAEGWYSLACESEAFFRNAVMPVTSETKVFYASTGFEIVGFVAVDARPGCSVVRLAYVEPTSRRQGICTAMLRAVEKWSRTKEHTEVLVERRDGAPTFDRTVLSVYGEPTERHRASFTFRLQ